MTDVAVSAAVVDTVTVLVSEVSLSVLGSGQGIVIIPLAPEVDAASLVPFELYNQATHPTHRTGMPAVVDPDGTNGVRIRYQSQRGARCGVIGTSIDVGSGSDMDSTFAVGRWGNTAWFTHVCTKSFGQLDMIKNAALGGDTLGGIGVLMDDFPAGSDHLDIRLTEGPPGTGPFNLESVFVGVGTPQQEGWYITDWDRIADYDPDPDYPDAACTRVYFTYFGTDTLIDHFKGEVAGWGMLGRFDRDMPDVDICFIGGPRNNTSKPDWTSENIAIGQQLLAEKALRRGMFPVLMTITPAAADQDITDDANRAIRNSIRTHGHAWADLYAEVVNPATRTIEAAISFDGLHYNQEGGERMGQRVMTQALDKMEIAYEQKPMSLADDDANNLLLSSNFLSGDNGVVGGGYAPLDWDVQEFFSSGIQQLIVPSRLRDRLGTTNLIRLTAVNGLGTRGIKQAVDITGWEEGDVIYMRVFARLYGFDPSATNFCKATVALGVSGSDGAVTMPVMYQYQRDWDGGIFSAEAAIPDTVGTITAASFSIALGCAPLSPGTNPGNGIFEAGAPTLVNLTKQDIL